MLGCRINAWDIIAGIGCQIQAEVGIGFIDYTQILRVGHGNHRGT